MCLLGSVCALHRMRCITYQVPANVRCSYTLACAPYHHMPCTAAKCITHRASPPARSHGVCSHASLRARHRMRDHGYRRGGTAPVFTTEFSELARNQLLDGSAFRETEKYQIVKTVKKQGSHSREWLRDAKNRSPRLLLRVERLPPFSPWCLDHSGERLCTSLKVLDLICLVLLPQRSIQPHGGAYISRRSQRVCTKA